MLLVLFNSHKNDKITSMNNTQNLSKTSEIYENIWVCMDKGVNDRLSDYHTFSLSTSCKMIPEIRTVVLRGCDREKQRIIFHTNNLTKKVNEIQDNPNVGALFYDKKAKVQIRFNGIAVINNGDEYCKNRWNKMSSQAQECYYQNVAPGKDIQYPEIVKNQLENKLSKNFTVITINIHRIEWLYLSSTGHTRVKFLKDKKFSGQWIAP